jgi:predicted nuclease of predicted toxin-antitoxin system
MLWVNDGDIIIKKELRKNNGSDILIHEHDFARIILTDEVQQSVICLTCGSSYCETSGKVLVSIMRTGKGTGPAHSLCN